MARALVEDREALAKSIEAFSSQFGDEDTDTEEDDIAETFDDETPEVEEPADDTPADDTASDEAEDGEADEEPAEGDDDGAEAEVQEEVAEDVDAEAVKNWNLLNERFAKEPVGMVQDLIQTMTDGDKAKLLEALGAEPAQAEALDTIPDDYEPESTLEAALLKRREWVLDGPKVVDRKITEFQESLSPYMQNQWALNAQFAAQNAVLKAVAAQMGMDIPAIDIAQVIEEVSSGKASSFEDAVAKRMDEPLKKNAKVAAQKRVQRPTTPGNSVSQAALKPGMTLMEVIRWRNGQ